MLTSTMYNSTEDAHPIQPTYNYKTVTWKSTTCLPSPTNRPVKQGTHLNRESYKYNYLNPTYSQPQHLNTHLSRRPNSHLSRNHVFNAPANNKEDHLLPCPKKPGEVRPSVMIHYMPHRTFETPILCTCIPDIELSKVIRLTSQRKCKSVENVSALLNKTPLRTYACSKKPAPRFPSLDLTKKKSLRKILLKPVKMLKSKLMKTVGSRSEGVKEPYCRCEPIDWDFPVITV